MLTAASQRLDAAMLRQLQHTRLPLGDFGLLGLGPSMRHPVMLSRVSSRASWCAAKSLCSGNGVRQRRWLLALAAAKEPSFDDSGSGGEGGSGSSGGGGGSGGGDANDGGSGDSGPSSLGSNVLVFVLAAATTLGLFKAVSNQLQRRKQQAEERARAEAAADEPEPGASDDFSTLVRLTQETFAELTRVKSRLDELEQEAGLSAGGLPPSDGSPVGGGFGSGGGQRGRSGSRQRGGRQRSQVSGIVQLGGGLLWAQADAAAAAGEALQGCGVKLGIDMLLQLSGLVRGGQDSVHAECQVNPGMEQVSLRKVLYNCRLGNRMRLVLAPFGARGRDAAYTLNPLAGQGLTSMVRDGSPLHHEQLGSLLGFAVEAARAWFNAGYFARASADGAAASSVLIQAVGAPTNTLSAGLTFVEHRSDATAAVTPSVTPSNATRASMAMGGMERVVGPALDGLPLRQLGSTLAWRLGDDAVLHGWASADLPEAQRSTTRPLQWGLVLGSYPDGSSRSSWAFGVGRAAAAEKAGGEAGSSSPNGGGGGGLGRLLPNLYELSLQFNMGEGLVVTPGMLLVTQDGKSTAFMGMKTAWAF